MINYLWYVWIGLGLIIAEALYLITLTKEELKSGEWKTNKAGFMLIGFIIGAMIAGMIYLIKDILDWKDIKEALIITGWFCVLIIIITLYFVINYYLGMWWVNRNSRRKK